MPAFVANVKMLPVLAFPSSLFQPPVPHSCRYYFPNELPIDRRLSQALPSEATQPASVHHPRALPDRFLKALSSDRDNLANLAEPCGSEETGPLQNLRGLPFDTRLCLCLEGFSLYRIFHLWVSDFFFLHSLHLFQSVSVTRIHALVIIKYFPRTLISAPSHDS